MKRVLLTTMIACLAGMTAVNQSQNTAIDAGEASITVPGDQANLDATTIDDAGSLQTRLLPTLSDPTASEAPQKAPPSGPEALSPVQAQAPAVAPLEESERAVVEDELPTDPTVIPGAQATNESTEREKTPVPDREMELLMRDLRARLANERSKRTLPDAPAPEPSVAGPDRSSPDGVVH